MERKSPSSIGILTPPTWAIGGYDRESPERRILVERIYQTYKDLSVYNRVVFNLPLLNGLPVELADLCLQNNIDYNTYNVFNRLGDFYSKMPDVIEDLIRINKQAKANFWPNGQNARYGPGKIIKCNKAIINDSEMIVIANHPNVYQYWLPFLKNKYHLYIDTEKLTSCRP